MTPKVVKKLERWTSTLALAALNASAPQRITGLSIDGFCSVTDMANLAMMADCFRMGLAFERLNIRGTVVAPTARARFLRLASEPVTSVNRLRHVPKLAKMEIRRNTGYADPDLPILPVAEPAHLDAPIAEVHAEARAWDPQDDVTMFLTPTQMTLTAFTDGSSVPGSRRCGGYSSIIFGPTGNKVEIGGHCKPSGMNYLSEMTAILATSLSCSAQAHLDIWTDCLSVKQAIGRNDSAERARIRATARPVLTCIRRAIRCRDQLGARTSFHHVRSHTGGDSFEEKGNSMADVRANLERADALHCESVPFLTGEEMFTAWIPDARGRMVHVIGDVRQALKRSVKRRILNRWCGLPRQGATPKTSPDGAALLSKLVPGQSSSELLRFTVLALCQWLPSGRYHGRIHHDDKARSGRWSCPSCPFAGQETSRHALLCPVRRAFLLEAADRARSLAEEAAEFRFGEITTLPDDRARCSFRLLRHEPRPGVAVHALSSMCRSGPIHDPHQALLGLCKSSTAPCSCHSGICQAHGWRPPVGVGAELRGSLTLETELFAIPGRIDCDFLQWYLLDPEGSQMGSAGSPWDCAWDGMFALCAPSLAPGAGPDVMGRILVKAHQAISSPRPTRIVLLLDRSLLLAGSPLAHKLVSGAKVIIIENAAAAVLSPSAQARETHSPGRCAGTGLSDHHHESLPYSHRGILWRR